MSRTYRLDLPNDTNELAALKSRRAELGYAIFRSGEYNICICHADSDGTLLLEDNIIANLHLDVDYVVCCYPATVKNVYPQLRNIIVGDWDSITVLEWDSDHINITPKLQ